MTEQELRNAGYESTSDLTKQGIFWRKKVLHKLAQEGKIDLRKGSNNRLYIKASKAEKRLIHEDSLAATGDIQKHLSRPENVKYAKYFQPKRKQKRRKKRKNKQKTVEAIHIASLEKTRSELLKEWERNKASLDKEFEDAIAGAVGMLSFFIEKKGLVIEREGNLPLEDIEGNDVVN